jgi:hypothetical protein
VTRGCQPQPPTSTSRFCTDRETNIDGHGLTGTCERAILLAGSFDAARDNGTFCVSARLPYQGPSA